MSLDKEHLVQLLEERIPDFSQDMPLHEQLDSIQIVALVLDIEKHFNIKLNLLVFGKKNLQSVDSLYEHLQKFK